MAKRTKKQIKEDLDNYFTENYIYDEDLGCFRMKHNLTDKSALPEKYLEELKKKRETKQIKNTEDDIREKNPTE